MLHCSSDSLEKKKEVVPVKDHTNYYFNFIFLHYHTITTLNSVLKKDLHYITLLPRKQVLMCLVLLWMTVAVPYLTCQTVISLFVCFNRKGFRPKACEEITDLPALCPGRSCLVIDLHQAKLDFMSGHLN